MAVTASFTPATGTLSVVGDALNNAVTVGRNAAGAILVNGGAVAITGGTATVANTTLIAAFGQSGDDFLTIDESQGAMPPANLFGSIGNDTLTGGSGGDNLFGQSENDTLFGKGGNDFLFGGTENDNLTGGAGDDQMFGEAGNDRMIWNDGDGTDLMEGGNDIDTAEVNGGNGGETFTITANGTRVRFDRTDAAPFALDIGTTENLVLNANGGNDRISATGNLAALIKLTIDGGAGNDVILGGNGFDTLLGGDGNDFIDGQQGNDVALLGAGDDVFQWDPGDGNDTVEGQAGNDALIFNGSATFENFDISANGERVRLTRNVANITMDLNGIETINLNTLGGADNIVVNDLSGTGVTRINVDLGGTIGGGSGDGAADSVTVTGRNTGDTIRVVGSGTSVGVTGLPAAVAMTDVEGANDALVVNGLDGHDMITAATLGAGLVKLTIDGGIGNDAIFGSQGNDTLRGGDGNDYVAGGRGNDIADLGIGNDVFEWNPDDGNDTIEGGDGSDTAKVNGGNGGETFAITANGTRVRFDRTDTAPFALDIGTTEHLVLNANDGNDTISAVGNLAPLIKLTIDGGAGHDTIRGGNGADTLLGGDGNDFIDGQQGDDVALLGAGDDVFQWDPGDGSDTVEGQAGTDALLFNGSATGENFDISANGDRVRLTRNIANITMDLKGIETINVNPLSAADNIVVNDLSGTGVTRINLDLGAAAGGGDGAADNVTVMGRNTADTIRVVGFGTSVGVTGLPAAVGMTDVEGANDVLVVHGAGGDDMITADALAAGLVKLTINGDAGNDTIFGSQGDDTLLGDDGNDYVSGGGGNDIVQLGAGNDVFQWNPGNANDTIEGGDGFDKMLFNGANSAENVDIFANGGHVMFTRDVTSVTMDLHGVEQIDFRALGGADRITVGDLSGTGVPRVNVDLHGPAGTPDGAVDSVTVNATQAADTIRVVGNAGGVGVSGDLPTTILTGMDATDQLVINGQDGDDTIDASGLAAGVLQLTINGGLGSDTMRGSQGGDLINGGDGNDIAFMGAGNDTFVWNPGDDNDIIEGEAGTDTLLFNGSLAAETIDIFGNGGRAAFTRDVATVAMDLNDVETVTFTARGGADTINVGDMSGTDVTRINLHLGGSAGGGDGEVDYVTVKGRNTVSDTIHVVGSGTSVGVTGLPAAVAMTNLEGANDILVVDGLGGNDTISATTLVAGLVRLLIDGGAGNDTIVGSQGNDVLYGGDGNDVVSGGGGNDVVQLGAGNDVFQWNPGDGNDTIDGGDGVDTLLFNGSIAAETINIFANGERAGLTRDVASAVMDLNEVETIIYTARSGADTINVGDMSGTAVTGILVDLGSAPGTPGGDGAADRIVINGTGGNDVIHLSVNSKGALVIDGLPSQVVIENLDFNDTITINGLGGNDTITAAGINLGGARLVLDGGAGDDALTGSLGNDTLIGGLGVDVLVGGGGTDEIFDSVVVNRALVANATFHEMLV